MDDMGVRRSRWNWLALALGFVIAFRLALWLYWLPERNAWINSHGGDPVAAAFGEGEMDAWALISTVGPWLMSLACCAIGSAPRLRGVLILGVLSGAGAFALGMVTHGRLGTHFGWPVATHGPSVIATFAVLALYYARRPRVSGPTAV